MGVITLTNATRNVTLDHVVGYRLTKKTTTPFHRIPNAQYAWVSRGATTTEPKRISIKARVDNTKRQNLELMESDRQVIDIADEHGNTWDNYTMENQEFDFQMGDETHPWMVSMEFLASAD